MRPKKGRSTKPIPVALSPELLARIDQIAEALDENRSVIMRMCMRIGLVKLEHSFEADAEHKPLRQLLNEAREPGAGPNTPYPQSTLSAEAMNDATPRNPAPAPAKRPRKDSGNN